MLRIGVLHPPKNKKQIHLWVFFHLISFILDANTESVALYRRGQRLNVLSLRDEFVESIVRALPTLAKFALAECDVDHDGPYKSHDLVADFLVQHQHHEPLLRLTGLQDTSANPLIPFLELYKKIHGISREPEPIQKVSDRYFPKVADGGEITDATPDTSDLSKKSDSVAQNNIDGTASIKIVGETTEKTAPAVGTANSDVGGDILTQPEETAVQAEIPQEKEGSQAPEAAPALVQASKEKREYPGFQPASQLIQQARPRPADANTPRTYDRLNPYKSTPKPPPVLLDGNRFDRNAFKSAIKMIRRHAAHKNLPLILWMESYVRAYKFGKTNPNSITPGFGTSTPTEANLQGANPYSKSDSSNKTPNPTPTQPVPTPKGSHSSTKLALTLCVNPSDLSTVGFNREPTDDDFEEDDEELKFYLLRTEFCERIAICDSIRTTSTKKYLASESNDTDFIYEELEDGSIDVSSPPTPKKLCFSPPAKQTENGRGIPTVSMRDRSPNIQNALARLSLSIKKCISQPNTLFVLQNSFNEKSALMNSIAEEEELEESANGTLKSLVADSGKDGKIARDSEKKRKLSESRDKERELQSYKDRLLAAEAKLAKLKKAKLDTDATTLKLNEAGGPKQGAQTKKSTPNSSNPTKPTVSFDQSNIHKGRGGRTQPTGRGRGRDGRSRGGRSAQPGRGGRSFSYRRVDSAEHDSTRDRSRQQQRQQKKGSSKSNTEPQHE